MDDTHKDDINGLLDEMLPVLKFIVKRRIFSIEKDVKGVALQLDIKDYKEDAEKSDKLMHTHQDI